MKTKFGLTVLQWALGIVILIEAILFVLPSAAHDFARTLMPSFIRMILGWGEIAGASININQSTTVREPWSFFTCSLLAIL